MTHKRTVIRLAAASCAALMALSNVGIGGDARLGLPLAHAGESSKAKKAAAPAKPAEVVVSDNARKLFRLGVSLLEDAEGARNEEAYRAFKAAYADSPSPKILGNLGLCAMRLERDREAIDAWSKYLKQVPDAPAEFRAQIERDLQTLTAGVANVVLKLSVAGASLLDERVSNSGKRVVNRYGPFEAVTAALGVRAGHHRLTITRDGYLDRVLEIDVEPGGTLSREVTLEKPKAVQPPPPKPKPKGGGDTGAQPSGGFPAGVWVGVGVTGALAIGTAITGGLALSKGSEFNDANSGADPVAAQDLRDQAGTLNLTTDILLGATVAAAITTTVLLFVLPSDVDEEASAGQFGPLQVDTAGIAPVMSATGQASGASLTIGGRF